MEHGVFGAPRPGVAYRDRPGAYGIAFDSQGRAAVVRNERKGVFLLGGGMEPGESEEDCIRREALEETGCAVTVEEKVCIGEEYATDLRGRPYHPIGHVYLVRLGEKVREPVESDHTLTWMPVEEFRSATFLRYQAWSMEMAWERYQKRQESRRTETEHLTAELEQMGVGFRSIHVLQEKDGVTVARVDTGGGSYVLKYLHRREFCREIDNYRILSSLGVPTLAVAASTDRAILLEDICAGPRRLGEEGDLRDPRTAALIARWYRELHRAGYRYLEDHPGCALYDENDLITPEHLEEIRRRTDTAELPVWRLLEDHMALFRRRLDGARRTLTYNDFYWTNLAVARDGTSALMFDYNLLGKGYAYADIRNVCSALSGEAEAAFLAEYGDFDEEEVLLDEVASVLTALYLACQRPYFPAWADDSLARLKTDLIDKVRQLL